MIKLILLGIVAGFFFSTTFVLNEVMSLDGGHWLWSASLRYFFMFIFLIFVILYQGGIKRLKEVFLLFFEYFFFWIISGTIGFGFFYALLCYSADYSPAWVVASTWQFTVISTLFVLLLFGKKLDKKVWFFSFMIFLGVCFINISNIEKFDIKLLVLGGLPVLIASFCYPLGNQLVWETKTSNYKYIPKIKSALLNNTFNKVMLLTMGSFPLWLILIFIIQPEIVSSSQLLNSAFVALFSGVIATTIFLYARSLAKNSSELAIVDSTQASEVVFSLLAGIIFLGVGNLSFFSILGLILIFMGLIFFAKYVKI